MGRRRSADKAHWPKNLYKNSSGLFFFRNPISRRTMSLRTGDERKAILLAKKINQQVEESEARKLPALCDDDLLTLDLDALLSLAHIAENSVKLTRRSGIYFLLLEGKVMYVGQSIDCERRIREHVNDPGKCFDSYFVTECDPADMDRLEVMYIRKFRPQFNVVRYRGGEKLEKFLMIR